MTGAAPILSREFDTAELPDSAVDTAYEDSASAAVRDGDVSLPTPKDRFGRYRLIRRLGRGGMSEVHLAYDPILERRLALKILSHRKGLSPASAERRQVRLHREARALAQFDHPNVIDVFDVAIEHGQVYLAMAHLEGSTLRGWLAARPRHWREIVDVMLQAGNGLVAAHEHGLVHRDFKPDNVMVSPEGQVRVLDFGIAYSHDEHSTVVDGLEDEHIIACLPAVQQSSSKLRRRLTQTGSVMGSPGYMAPEQRRGLRMDARVDQFAFCVSFFEGLYGRTPIAGSRPKPSAHRRTRAGIPRQLYALLVRGLSIDPAERHDSLAGLLADIRAAIADHDARQRRRQFAFLGVCMASVLLLAGMGPRPHQRTDPCPIAHARWAGIWDSGRKAVITRAFMATGVPWARDTADRVATVLDQRKAAWLDLHHEVCAQTRIRKFAPDTDMDTRMACLDTQLDREAALLEQLSQADSRILRRASQAVAELPQALECRDADHLRAHEFWPESVDQHARVATARRQLLTVHALRSSGQFDAALREAHALLPAVLDTGFAPLEAELEHELGKIHRWLERPQAALEHLRRALLLSQAEGMVELAAKTAVTLVFVRGYLLGDNAALSHLVAQARSMVQRAGSPPELLAQFRATEGVALAIQRDLEPARIALRESLDIRNRLFGPDSAQAARSMQDLATVYAESGRPHAAIRMDQQVVNIFSSHLGPSHPELVVPMMNLGLSYQFRGHLRAGHRHVRRAFDICRDAGTSANCTFSRFTVIRSTRRVGRYAEALAMANEQMRAQERAGINYSSVPPAQALIAEVLTEMGRPERAVVHARRALALLDLDPRSMPKSRGPSRRALARAHLEAGHPELALEIMHPTVLPRRDGEFGIQDTRLLGDIRLALGDWSAALALHERALERVRERRGPDSPAVADYALSAARSQLAAGDPSRADDFARLAHDAILRGLEADNHRLHPFLGTLGDVELALGRPARAAARFREALRVFDDTESLPARRAPWQFGLAKALDRLARCSSDGGTPADAHVWAERAAESYDQWGKAGASARLELAAWMSTRSNRLPTAP